MKVQGMPTTGCNVFYGSYIDNYVGSTRSRYYIYDGVAVKSQTSTNVTQPNGANCITAEDLSYKPEIQIFVGLAACIASLAVFAIALKLVLGRALK